MMPMYMNSSQPSQVRPQGHYHQGLGNFPHHIPMDAPSPCYGSCVHGNFPAYNAYWSPCCPPQVPYHPCSMNYYGFHPHASQAPPCYVHQPWFYPDKNVPGKNHCAKCSPQMCYPKTDRSVVIEEHEPEKGDAVKPLRSTNCPYPVIWIPHEDARDQEHGGSPESGSHERCTEIQKRDPKSWNGRFPIDENTMKSLIQNLNGGELKNGNTVELPFDVSKLRFVLPGQEGKEAQMQKNKEPGQLSYPVFWIPSHAKQEDFTAAEDKEPNKGPNSISRPIPSDLHANEGQIIRDKGEEGNICKVSSGAFMRNIPVENHQQQSRNIPVKSLENHLPKPTEQTKSSMKIEPVEKKKKEQRSSPTKASRLPPVCLRVDPLPKRKNGGSNSSSPPKQNEQRLTSKDTKVTSSPSSKKVETRTAATEKESVESKTNLQEGANCEIIEHCETKEKREKLARKTFTEDEAARIIQSRYRGYEVRRLEPLKKLKEIATVREQMGDIKKRIQGLEISNYQHIEEKEIIILGEMVMSLLLKLDSVQGLHPSIKDHRKSLARELSDIQEKLDSMRKSKEGAVKEQVAITSLVDSEHSHLTVENKMAMHHLNTEKVAAEEEEGTGSVETLAMNLEPATEVVPEKVGEVETVVPVDLQSGDGEGKSEEDKVAVESVEELTHELPQLVAGLNANEVSEAEANAMRKEDKAMVESLEELPHELPRVVTGLNVNEVSEAEANAMSEEDKVVVESLEELPHELPQVVTGLNANEVSEAEANAMRKEDKALEELPHELPQVVTCLNATEVDANAMSEEDEAVVGNLEELSLELPPDFTEVSEAKANASENEAVVSIEKDVELSELPIRLTDDGMQVLPQDTSLCFNEEKLTPMDPEAEAMALEIQDRKEEYDTLLLTEKDVEVSELSTGVFSDEMLLLSQDSSSCTGEMKMTAMETETTNQEESDSEDKEQHVEESEVMEHELPEESKRLMEQRDSNGIGQEPQEDKERETSEVKEHEVQEEAKMLKEENQRYKEMMETLVKAGREQLEVISKLTGRVKSLEKKLSQKKKRTQIRRGKHVTKSMSEGETYDVL